MELKSQDKQEHRRSLHWRQDAPWGPRAFFGAVAVDKHVLVFGGIRTPEVAFSKENSCTHHRWNMMEHAGFKGKVKASQRIDLM